MQTDAGGEADKTTKTHHSPPLRERRWDPQSPLIYKFEDTMISSQHSFRSVTQNLSRKTKMILEKYVGERETMREKKRKHIWIERERKTNGCGRWAAEGGRGKEREETTHTNIQPTHSGWDGRVHSDRGTLFRRWFQYGWGPWRLSSAGSRTAPAAGMPRTTTAGQKRKATGFLHRNRHKYNTQQPFTSNLFISRPFLLFFVLLARCILRVCLNLLQWFRSILFVMLYGCCALSVEELVGCNDCVESVKWILSSHTCSLCEFGLFLRKDDSNPTVIADQH